MKKEYPLGTWFGNPLFVLSAVILATTLCMAEFGNGITEKGFMLGAGVGGFAGLLGLSMHFSDFAMNRMNSYSHT